VALAEIILLVIPYLQTTGDSSFEKCELIHALQWAVNALILDSAQALSTPHSRGEESVSACAHESC